MMLIWAVTLFLELAIVLVLGVVVAVAELAEIIVTAEIDTPSKLRKVMRVC